MYSRQTKDTVNYSVLINRLSELMGDELWLLSVAPFGSLGVKAHRPLSRAQELCETRGGRPELPSLIVLIVSVDVEQN